MNPFRKFGDAVQLLNGLRRIWFRFTKVTPQMVVDSIKLIIRFITGKSLMLALFICAAFWSLFSGQWDWLCGPHEPTQVLAAPTYELIERMPERSLLAPQYNVVITVGDGSRGKGTLIESDSVITCFHLFTDSDQDIVVHFPNGDTAAAVLWRSDKTYDLALLVIQPVTHSPAKLSGTKDLQKLTTVRGSGPFVRWYRPSVQASAASTACIDVEVKSGDSGSGVFNDGGLYGVVWGCVEGQTYATSGAGFRQLVRDFLASRPDRLVVVSTTGCAPCVVMGRIADRLAAAGYDASHVIGPKARSYPMLLLYSGERLVLEKVGPAEYDYLAAVLKRKTHGISDKSLGGGAGSL